VEDKTNSCVCQIETGAREEDVRAVQDGLREYNLRFAPADGYQPLTIFLRGPDGSVVGGLLGETYWGWLHVDRLWIGEAYRRGGYGRQLLQMAEAEARRRGCAYAHLDTMSFQAPDFYFKNGYTVYGELADLPTGHKRIFLMKKL